VLRFWEHEDVEACARRVIASLSGRINRR